LVCRVIARPGKKTLGSTKTEHGTIDVKSIVDVNHNLLHPINEKMCDIIVLAMVYVPLSLRNVDLFGWCYKDQLQSARVREFSKEDPQKVDAHVLPRGALKEAKELENLFGLNIRGEFKNLAVELPKPEPKPNMVQQKKGQLGLFGGNTSWSFTR
jgi:hypothetical protein